VILAFSVHSFVDKIGAYVAFAAVVGLALMALLLFAQARELRRLREWGAHAHDRIGELERRLAAALELARRASAPQRTMAPTAGRTVASPAARPAGAPGAGLGGIPAPRGPVPARTSSPTRLPLLPAAPVGVAGAALGSATVVLPLPKHPPAVATPAPAGTAAAPATTVAPAARPAVPAAMPSAPAASPAAAPTVAASAPPAPAAAAAASAPAAPSAPAPATAAGQGATVPTPPAAAPVPAPAPAAPAPVEAAANGHSDTFPPVPPVRRPLPPTRAGAPAGRAARPGSTRGTGRPGAAAPLRQRSAPSASPRGAGVGMGGGGGERRGGSPSARPRIVLLLVGLAVLAAIAIAVLALSGGGSSPSRTSASTGAPTRQATSTASRSTATATTVPHGRITVAVLNGTATPGLANTVANALTGAGFVKGPVGNASDQQRSVTVVSYFDGHEAEAQEVAQTLRVPGDAVQPIDTDTERACGQGAPAACTAPVVVTVGADRQ